MKRQPLLRKYASLIFDCDGVVLNSNKVKTEAFYQATSPYGEGAAEAMVEHHIANGGVSRYKKFAHFLQKIVPEQAGPGLEVLLESYASEVVKGLFDCESADGLMQLREQTPRARWFIVSGGDQAELRSVFAQRGLADLFDGGIFGSPDTKEEILSRELGDDDIYRPALFLGDSRYDYRAASQAGMDFVFLSGWTEVANWERWVNDEGLMYARSIRELL